MMWRPAAGAVDGSLTTNEVGLIARRAQRHASEVSELASMESAEPMGDVGDPAGCILATACDHKVDVVVVYHDRSWFSRLLTPSVSREVVRESEVPVLVVKWPGRFNLMKWRPAMLVELDDAEVEAVAAVMDSAILELSPEIVAADNWEHRAQLRDRRAVLQTALGKLRPDAVTEV